MIGYNIGHDGSPVASGIYSIGDLRPHSMFTNQLLGSQAQVEPPHKAAASFATLAGEEHACTVWADVGCR